MVVSDKPTRTPVDEAAAYEAMVMGSDTLYDNAKLFRRVLIPTLVGMAMIIVLQFVFAMVRDSQYDKVENRVVDLQGQVKLLHDHNERTIEAANKAAVAASAAQASLEAAIAQSQQTSNGSNEAIKQIAEIREVCVIRKEC
jgi:Na+-transporting NADH:ubiquinone oxidoreductase subunit NqrC